jgi:hypothetical protein
MTSSVRQRSAISRCGRSKSKYLGKFEGEGEAARGITYRARVSAKARREEILELMHYTDAASEIQNTLRRSSPVVLSDVEVEEV